MIQTLLKFRNPDSTRDLNNTLQGFLSRGIVSGGEIVPVAGVLQIDVTPFKLIGVDGMVVAETSATARLNIVAGQVNVVVFKSQYVDNGLPLYGFEVLELSAYQARIDIDYLTVFGYVSPPPLATQAVLADISYLSRDQVDPLQRLIIRGVVASSPLLPSSANTNRPGDGYLVTTGAGDSPTLWVWNGINFVNVTDAATVATELSAHRQNLYPDEIHLTDDQAAAALGSAGAPGVEVGNVTIDIGTSTFTFTVAPSVPLVVGMSTIPTTSGLLPSPLIPGTEYFMIVLSTTTFRVAATQGDAILSNFIGLSGAQSGAHQVTIPGNVFVTSTDSRLPLQSENDALIGIGGTPSTTNPFVTAAYTLAQPIEKLFVSTNIVTLVPTDGPFYVGVGTLSDALKYFRVYHPTQPREYLTSAGSIPIVPVGLYKDAGLMQPLVPSGEPTVIAASGFYNGTLYVVLSSSTDTQARMLYGKQKNFGSPTAGDGFDKGLLLTRTPGDAQTSYETLQRLAAISGRQFDDPVPTDEQNINLRIDANLLKTYTAAVTAGDVVLSADQFARLRDFDGNSPSGLFTPNFPKETGEQILFAGGVQYNVTVDFTTFDNTIPVAVPNDEFVMKVIEYQSPVVLTSVQPGHIFLDSFGERFRILAVKTSGNGSLIVYSGDRTVDSTLTVTAGAVYQANNPRQLELNDHQSLIQAEMIPVEGIDSTVDEFEDLPPGGLNVGVGATYTQIGTAVLPNQGLSTGTNGGRPIYRVLPRRQGNRVEQRVRLIGNWKNDQTAFSSQVVGQVSQNGLGIEYTGRVKDLTLEVGVDAAFPYRFRIFVNGAYHSVLFQFDNEVLVAPPISVVQDFHGARPTVQKLKIPLALDPAQIHTVRIEVTAGSGTSEFRLYGISPSFGQGSHEEKGRVFSATALKKTDTVLQNVTSSNIPAAPDDRPDYNDIATSKAAKVVRYIDRNGARQQAVTQASTSSAIGVVGTGTNQVTLTGVAQRVGQVLQFSQIHGVMVSTLYGDMVAGDPIHSDTYAKEFYARVTQVNGTLFDFNQNIPAGAGGYLPAEYIVQHVFDIPVPPSGQIVPSAPESEEDEEYARFQVADWTVGAESDIANLATDASEDRTTVLLDGGTMLRVKGCQRVETGIEGFPEAIRLNTTTSEMIVQAYGTRQDFVFVGSGGPVNVAVEVDGLHEYTLFLRGDGVERHTMFFKGAPQTHIVRLYGASAGQLVAVGAWILHDLKAPSINGVKISEYSIITATNPPTSTAGRQNHIFAGNDSLDTTYLTWTGGVIHQDPTLAARVYSTLPASIEQDSAVRYGRYLKTNANPSATTAVVFGFNGIGAEFGIDTDTNRATARIYVDGQLLSTGAYLTPGGTVTVIGNGFDPATGILTWVRTDSSPRYKRLIISGLDRDYHEITFEMIPTGTGEINFTTFGYYPAVAAIDYRNPDNKSVKQFRYLHFKDVRRFITLLPEQVGVVSGQGGETTQAGITELQTARSGLVDLSNQPYYFGVYNDWQIDAAAPTSAESPCHSEPGFTPINVFFDDIGAVRLGYVATTGTGAGGTVFQISSLILGTGFIQTADALIGTVVDFQSGTNATLSPVRVANAVQMGGSIDVTLERTVAAMAADVVVFKQTIHTRDLVQFKPGQAGDNQSIADRVQIPVPSDIQDLISKDIGSILVDAETSDGSLTGDAAKDPTYPMTLAFQANCEGVRADGETPDTADPLFWSVKQDLPAEQVDVIPSYFPSLGANNERLFLRLFPSQTVGNGYVYVQRWACLMFDETTAASLPRNRKFMFGYTDNSSPAVGGTITVSGGKTRLTFAEPYFFNAFPGTTDSILEIWIDGKKLPRETLGVTMTDAYFTEVSPFVVDLDQDYSGAPLSVDVRYRSFDDTQIRIGTYSPLNWVQSGFIAPTGGAPLDGARTVFEPRTFSQLVLRASNSGVSGTTTVEVYRNGVLAGTGSLAGAASPPVAYVPVSINCVPTDSIYVVITAAAINSQNLTVELS